MYKQEVSACLVLFFMNAGTSRTWGALKLLYEVSGWVRV